MPILLLHEVSPNAPLFKWQTILPISRRQVHQGAPLGKNLIAAISKDIAMFLGLNNPRLYTGHAFRVSSATVLADEGANSLTLKRHGRWASDSVAEGYLRESKQVRTRTADLLSGNAQMFRSVSTSSSTSGVQNKTIFANCVFNGNVVINAEQSSETLSGKANETGDEMTQ